jgi:RHS repeat-associated protein
VVIGGGTPAANTLINREEYTPYGETSFGSFAKKRYRFTGKERDGESGLYYHGARYYAPWLARWVSCDPKGMVDGVNLYLYGLCNPVRFVDAGGLQAGEAKKAPMTNATRPNESPAADNLPSASDLARILSIQAILEERRIWNLPAGERGKLLHALFENMPSNNPGFDKIKSMVLQELKTIGSSTKDVKRPIERAISQLMNKSPIFYRWMKKEIVALVPSGTGPERIAQITKAFENAASEKGFLGSLKVQTGLSGAGRLLKLLGPLGIVLSGLEFRQDLKKGDWKGAVGSGAALASSAIETAALASPLMAGGLSGLPPVAVGLGGFSLGWKAGTWLDKKSGASEFWGDAIGNTFYRITGGGWD